MTDKELMIQKGIIYDTATLLPVKGNVPVSVAAKVYGKDAQWIRAGLISGYLPIGTATKDGKKVTDLSEQGHSSRINYYISPKLLYEQTGYIWEGEKR